jgi:nucleoside phosphorylase
MTTQLALDRFTIDKIVFSGIAGGVDPKLTIGDVVVPDAWSEYLETVFAREKDGRYERICLTRKPTVLVGGHGVSGQAFVDNNAFRDYARKTFGAEVLDMESAGVAQVAYANHVPFIAFRSLSDLAGGGAAENEMGTFFQLASDNSAAVVRAFLKALP